MGIIIRQSAITTVLLYVGAVLGYINLLYLFPRFMSLEEVGTVRTLQDMAALLVPVAQFGLSHSLIRFLPKSLSQKKDKKAFMGLMLLLGVIGFALFLILFLVFRQNIVNYFSPNAPEITAFIPHVIAITFLLVLFNLLAAYAQSLLKVAAATFIKDVIFRLLTAFALLLYFWGYLDFASFILAMIVSYGAMVLSLVLYLMYKNELGLRLDFTLLKRQDLQALILFALFSLLGTSGMLIIGKIDSIMVTGMLGSKLNGLYTTVFYIAVVIEFPKRAINQISLPLVARSFEAGNVHEVDQLYKQSSINQLLIGGLLFVGIWINMDSIFRLMPQGDVFSTGKWVIILIGVGRLFDMMAGINSEIIVMSRYYKFNVILLALLAVFTILFNLTFIPTLGIEGAALGSALALILFNIAKFIFLFVKMKIQPFTGQTFSALGILGMCLIIGLLLPNLQNALIDMAFRSLVVTIFFGIMVIWLKPSVEIDGIIKKFISGFLRKL